MLEPGRIHRLGEELDDAIVGGSSLRRDFDALQAAVLRHLGAQTMKARLPRPARPLVGR